MKGKDLIPDSEASVETVRDLHDILEFMLWRSKSIIERYDDEDLEHVPYNEYYIMADDIDASDISAIRIHLPYLERLMKVLEKAVDDDMNRKRRIVWDGEKFIDLAQIKDKTDATL